MTATGVEEVRRVARDWVASVDDLVLCWGRPREDGLERPRIHDVRRPADVDLLDVAAVTTLEKGGAVFPRVLRDIPGRTPAAAILRY